MSGETISGRSAGIRLTNAATQNPLTVTSTGEVYSADTGYAVYGNQGIAWTIENQGIVSDKYGFGVVLLAGGTIINGSADNPIAVIAGGKDAVLLAGGTAPATIINYGWIDSTDTFFDGLDSAISLGNGGTVTNETTGLITGIVGIETQGSSMISNDGAINAVSTGVILVPGSTLINAGKIEGGFASVAFDGNDRLVIEPGAVFSGNFIFQSSNNALELAAPTGTIGAYGFDSITIDSGANWTLTGNNTSVAIDGSGTITNTGTLAGAVVARLEAGGGFTNAAGAVVDGTVYGVATAHTVTNLGTIVGYSNGVGLGVGGTFVNGSSTDTTAFVSGYYGVLVDRAAGAVANYGTIVGRSTGGVALEEGGAVANGSATDANAAITGRRFGVGVFGASGTITNFATIAGTGSGAAGIKLEAGGTVANQTGGLISGVYAVDVFGGSGSVSNAGRIGTGTATEEGIFLAAGGSVINAAGASISAMYGVLSDAGATLTNAGSITGTTEGVFIDGTGSITNGAPGTTSALIAGASYGVQVGAGSTIMNYGKVSASAGPAIATSSYAVDVTVVNAGTISGTGGVAVNLGGGVSRLVIDPGAVFKGNVVAQGSGNTLELAAGAKVGSIKGLGSSFIGFNIVALDPSANWTVSGSNGLGANSDVVTGPGGKLTVTGSVQAGSGLNLIGSGTIAVGSAGAIEIGMAGGAKPGSITVDAGTTLTASGTLKAAVVDNGSLVVADATTIAGNLTGAGAVTIDPGVVLDVSGQVGLAGIGFIGGSTTLELGQPANVSGTLSGFGTGDNIDLLHAAMKSASFFDNTLTVGGAKGVIASLQFAPGLSAANFLLASDQHGGTIISFVPS
ncbi:MAG TPA: hypothetical protein VIZ17_17870 [Acetobacteraceae bacterium]